MNKENKIFKNNVDINNNLEYYYSEKNSELKNENVKNSKYSNKSVNDILDDLIKHKRYLYTEEVLIRTKDKNYKTRIVSINNNEILTIDNDTINISDIEKIEQ